MSTINTWSLDRVSKKNEKNLKTTFPCCFFSLIGGVIDREINITITFQQRGLKEWFFSFEIAWRMDAFEGINNWYLNQLTKLGGNKVFRSRSRAAMFVVSFANFKSRALSRDPSGDHMMPRTEVRKYYCYEPP